MRTHLSLLLALSAFACAPAAIAPEELSIRKVEPGKEDSSAEAVFVDFTFDGELVTDRSWGAASQVEDQLLYTIGHLNGDRAVGRLDQVVLTDVTSEREGELTRVRYTATMPVAWGRRDDVPSNYTLKLPRDIRSSALTAFAEAHGHACVDFGAHDVDSGSMWYYYRPNRSGCALAAEEIIEVVADVTPSAIQTTGRFPEYDEVWADETLRVVAVFGKYEDGAATSSDAGISAYQTFVNEMARVLRAHELTTTPTELPTRAGVDTPEIVLHAVLDDGGSVEVVALLVDNVRNPGAAFDRRYAELSGRADLITYNGHAGLGSNIRALAQKGRWIAGQYAIVFMNGCDSYAYVDSALWDAHSAVNLDDPEGTKYLDILSNALPAYFRSMPRATLALIEGLMAREEPRTYEEIFRDVDSSQVILVSGEQDNDYVPNAGGTAVAWAGMTESGELARGDEARFETPVLEPGTYVFEMTGTGDADLHVRIGSAATTAAYDCRPYRSNANEVCEIELAATAPIHVMVSGYSASTFSLVASPR